MTDDEKRKQAEERREERRQQRAASEVPADVKASAPAVPIPLKVMLRSGVLVTVEGAGGENLTFEIGRILIKDQERYEQLSASFDMLLLSALANSYDELTDEYDMDKMAFIVNTVFKIGAEIIQEAEGGNDTPPPSYTAADCAGQVELFTSRPFTPETRGEMVSLVSLVLSRKHPEMVASEVEEWLDLTSFLTIIRAFYRVNHGVRDRF